MFCASAHHQVPNSGKKLRLTLGDFFLRKDWLMKLVRWLCEVVVVGLMK